MGTYCPGNCFDEQTLRKSMNNDDSRSPASARIIHPLLMLLNGEYRLWIHFIILFFLLRRFMFILELGYMVPRLPIAICVSQGS